MQILLQKGGLKYWLFGLLVLFSQSAAAQVTVAAQLDSADIMIGDQVGLTLFINHAPGVEIDRIDWAPLDEVKEIEVLNYGTLNTVAEGSEVLLEQKLTLTSFDSGYYRIPRIPVFYKYDGKTGVEKSEQLAIMVNTIDAQSDTTQLAPIKNIVEEPLKLVDFLPYLAGLAGLGLLVLLFFYLSNRKNRQEAPPQPAITLPAHEIALKKLEDLKQAKLWQRGEIKHFQSELTFVIREYLENRFEVPALESTTDEIAREFRRLDFDKDWKEKLISIFRTADLVKFAKAEPSIEVHQQALDNSESFIRETKSEEVKVEIETESELEIEQPSQVMIKEVPEKVPLSSPIVTRKEDFRVWDENGNPIELAGFWPRFFARIIDINLFPILILSISFGIGVLFNLNDSPSYFFIIYIFFFIFCLWAYFAFMEHWKGGTLGKLLLGIRVVTLEGKKISIARASMRFFGKLISEGLFFMGYVLYFFDKKKRQTLHDKMAGTIVINKPKISRSQALDAGLD